MKLLFYSFLFIVASCHTTKKTEAGSANSTANSSGSTSAGSTAHTAGTSASGKEKETGTVGGPETIVITFEKSVCFGTCPAFKMTLSAETNKAVYIGTSNVDKIGTFEKNITDEEILKLKGEFDKAKFFDMQDEYTSAISDIPSTYVGLSVNGKTKTVKDKYQAPKELKDLELLLDKIANSDGWEKVKEKE